MAKRSGYFLVYRDIWRSPVFKNLLQCSCWIYFISSASHQDKTLNIIRTLLSRYSRRQLIEMIEKESNG